MGKKEKDKTSKKAAGKEKKAKADKPGTAKYEYPKNCTTDADKKKYRSLMRAGKEWEGPGKAGGEKASKKGKDHGPGKSVHLKKGKKVGESVSPGSQAEHDKKKAKKEKAVAQED